MYRYILLFLIAGCCKVCPPTMVCPVPAKPPVLADMEYCIAKTMFVKPARAGDVLKCLETDLASAIVRIGELNDILDGYR